MELTWIPKGGRKARQVVKTFEPFAAVWPGHGHPDPDVHNWRDVPGTVPGVKAKTSVYSIGDTNGVTDWNDRAAGYLAAENVRPLFFHASRDYRECVSGMKPEPAATSAEPTATPVPRF